MRTKIIVGSLLLASDHQRCHGRSLLRRVRFGRVCDYLNLEDCLRAAGRDGGCEVNPKEDKASSGTAPFCLVTPIVRSALSWRADMPYGCMDRKISISTK